MTRCWMVALLMSCLCGAGWSQGNPGLAVSETLAERARIESVRQQKKAELDAEESACLSRFAVTDCQNEVGVRRRQMLSELKRQETILNAAERKQRGLEQLQREGTKAGENLQRQLEAQATINKRALENREQTQNDKQRVHQLQAQPVQNQAGRAQSSSALDAKTTERNREAYLEKQRSLGERRQERDRRLLDQGKDVRPLPLPP